MVNSDQPKSTIPIAQIAPDLILADLPRNIMLNTEDLEFDQRPEFLLGKYIAVTTRFNYQRLDDLLNLVWDSDHVRE